MLVLRAVVGKSIQLVMQTKQKERSATKQKPLMATVRTRAMEPHTFQPSLLLSILWVFFIGSNGASATSGSNPRTQNGTSSQIGEGARYWSPEVLAREE